MAKKFDGKELKQANQQVEYTEENLKELQKCKNDIYYYATNYHYTRHPSEGLIKVNFENRPYQRKMIDAFVDNRFSIVLASRQLGKTTCAEIYLMWKTLFERDKHIAILANKQDRAKSRIREIQTAYKQLPVWMKPGIEEWRKTSLTFDNGNRVFIETTTVDALAGESVSHLFLDEFGRVDPKLQQEFWAANYPTISEGGNVIIVSTPMGSGDKFHELWTNAVQGKNSFKPVRVDWWEHPDRDEDWKEQEIKNLGSKIMFNREHGLSFTGSIQTLIDPDVLQRLSHSEPNEVIPQENGGDLKVWERPIPGHVYLLSADVALGVQDHYSVAHVFDITSKPYNQVATWRSNKIGVEYFKRVLFGDANHKTGEVYETGIAQMYNDSFFICESNAMGEELLNHAHYTMNYENIFIDWETNGRRGAYSTRKSRFNAIRCLRDKENDQVFALNDKVTIKELKQFIKKGDRKFAGRGSTNDDTVMALAWAAYFMDSDYWVGMEDWIEQERIENRANREKKTELQKAIEEELEPVYRDKGPDEYMKEAHNELKKWLQED